MVQPQVAVYGGGFFIAAATGPGEHEIFRVYGRRATRITSDGGGKGHLAEAGNRLLYDRSDSSGEAELVVLSLAN